MSRPTSLLALCALLGLVGCDDRSVFGATDAGRDARRDAADAPSGDGSPLDAPPLDAVASDTPTDAPPIDALLADVRLVDAALSDTALTDAFVDARSHLGPAPVELGAPDDLAAAGAYVLIGKTGITNVTGSLVVGGHLGVSPELSPAITGFALILDASGRFSTSVSVAAPWRVYAADYAVPTPTNLTSAILDMEGAYADAASRELPDFSNLLDGHVGGAVLAPGLYTWGSSVDVSAELTFLGGADDVWILQVSNDVELGAAIRMTLAGGARASRIFWQVAGQVTTRAGSHFEGIVLCQTGFTMQTGASLHGRAYAQSLVALDDNEITAP